MFGGNQNGQEALGTVLSDTQIKSMLEGKKTFVKGLKGKKGSYDAYLIQEGIEDYNYTKMAGKSKVHSIRSSWSSQKRNKNVLLLCARNGII